MSRTQITTSQNLRKEDKSIKVVAGISSLLGLWLIGTSLLLGAPSSHLVSNVVTGGLISALAGRAYFRKRQSKSSGRTKSASRFGFALVGLLGLWAIATPFVFPVDGVLFWNDIVVGVLVAMTSVYNVSVASIDTSDRLIQQSNERPPRSGPE